MYTLDRFEGEIAVLENRETKEIINVKRNLVQNFAKEGDILELVEGKYVVNIEKTNQRRQYIINLMEKLKKK